MAQVTVTKQFKEDFDLWAADAIQRGEYTEADMAELKAILRNDFQPGPDQQREQLEFLTADGVVSAMIDSYEERIKVWTNFFAACANEIRSMYRRAA
jgi:hypothetical protein